MANFRVGKPSASMIVAVVALVMALGGTSYAAFSLPSNSVGSRQIKGNAVTSKKIKNGAVTAGKINAAGLTVPNATHANTANRATNAGTVGGSSVTRVDLAPAANTTTTIFSGDGLTLNAICDGSADLGITAQSTDPKAELNDFGQTAFSGPFRQTIDGTGTSPFTILTTGSNEGSIEIQFASTSGHAVTANLGMDFSAAFATAAFSNCGVWGTIISG